MIQIIVYDIPKDTLRGKVSHTLEDFGFIRLQYSVFIGSRTQNALEELSLLVQDIIADEEADIRIYQICEKCEQKTMIISMIGLDPNMEEIFPCH